MGIWGRGASQCEDPWGAVNECQQRIFNLLVMDAGEEGSLGSR